MPETVRFKGGQILIREGRGQVIIEIHTKLGWRIAVLSDPTRTGIGKGRGGKETDLRVFLCHSKKKESEDRYRMEKRASERVDDTRYKIEMPEARNYENE